MYQEQFLIKSKWIVLLLIITLFLIHFFVKSKKYSLYIIIISIVIGFSLLYILFLINQQPKIPLLKSSEVLSPSSGYIGDIYYHKNGETTIMFNLSFFSNHIQYIPYKGKVIKDEYIQSKYLRPKRMFTLHPSLFPNFEESIRDNEQYQTILLTDIGNISITRIAGLVAPRVHSFINDKTFVKQGDVMGVIIFSSMVLLTLPPNVKLNIKKGDTAIAGETIIANKY